MSTSIDVTKLLTAMPQANHSLSNIQNCCLWAMSTCCVAVYLRIWEMLGIMMHPENIDAHFGASWQHEPTQLCFLTGLSNLHSHIIPSDRKKRRVYSIRCHMKSLCTQLLFTRTYSLMKKKVARVSSLTHSEGGMLMASINCICGLIWCLCNSYRMGCHNDQTHESQAVAAN